jgi:hypothetical protein
LQKKRQPQIASLAIFSQSGSERAVLLFFCPKERFFDQIAENLMECIVVVSLSTFPQPSDFDERSITDLLQSGHRTIIAYLSKDS